MVFKNGTVTDFDNYKKTVFFDSPDFIPMTFHINDACWHHYDQNMLLDLMESHKFLFPDFERPDSLPYVPEYSDVAKKDIPYTDDFGCIWETADDGITGTVTGHPLENWDNFSTYKAPDPEKCMGIGSINWDDEYARIKNEKADHGYSMAGLRHGHTFLQLSDLRGYQNLLFDMMDDDKRLYKLIDMVEQFNGHIIDRYIDAGADQISYPEDLGMQTGPMISPAMFEKFIFPSYRRLMEKAQSKGRIVHMHSDGDIKTLADYLTHGGVQILNLQDSVNGIEWIRDRYCGKVCIELDIDRQHATVNGTPESVDAFIKNEIDTLGNKKGGLMMIYGLYPGVPAENVKALMDAMEKYAPLR